MNDVHLITVYDDMGKKSEIINEIIGDKGFSQVVVKRKTLEEVFRMTIASLAETIDWYKVDRLSDYDELYKKFANKLHENIRIVHWFSNFIISNEKEALLSLAKIKYVEGVLCLVCRHQVVGVLFGSLDEYISFLKSIYSGNKAWDIAQNYEQKTIIDGVKYIGSVYNFIQCITGAFDARYFNSLTGDNEFTITKSSQNIKKIKAEYTYYHLLPEYLRRWFVMPFNYVETETSASYTMERLHMTDLAIRYVHGSMKPVDLEEILDIYFYYFKERPKRECSEEVYKNQSQDLYWDKIISRLSELKKHKHYQKLVQYMNAESLLDLEDLVERYKLLREKIESSVDLPCIQVVGHGDPCFSNTLYNKTTKTFKFIDPKGALNEEELWTNPYYDLAKLSHSVCGCYDFFNNGLVDIKVNSDFKLELDIANEKLKQYQEVFKRKLSENGYSYTLIRIYEVSLFLSMLPLHMDIPYKVLGFILNARRIIEELELDVR